MDNFIYNPIVNKKPMGACVCDTEVTYTLKVSKFLPHEECFFVVHRDGENPQYHSMTRSLTDDKYISYETKYKFVEAGLYWYHFEVKTPDRQIRLIRSDSLDLIESNNDSDYMQSVITSESSIDPAFRKGIIYHVFIDRFNRVGKVKARKGLNLIDDWDAPLDYEYNEIGERINANCFGGNFRGIIEKLPYLKSLNVSTIYLSPVFEAHSSHKYDVADYSKVDSMFGTFDDFDELIKKAKKLGMKIIIDGVFNHTGSDSVYFNKYGRYRTVGAYQNINSKYYDWYDFNVFPDDYACWWGVKCLPQTREESGFFDYIAGKCGIIHKYIARGVAGIRLDVVDELTNNFLRAICKSAREVNPKAMIIGEVWEDASSKIAYDERKQYFLGGNLDSVTNYPMKNAILEYIKHRNINGFVNIINLIKDQYPKSVQDNLMNILGTHDTVRVLTYLGINDNNYIDYRYDYTLNPEERLNAIKLLKLATIMQYTVMGIPTVYYGDEAGMEGLKDPYCRKTFPWGKENLDITDWYQKLGKLRTNIVFIDGDLNIKYAQDGVIIYERVKGDNKVIIAINRGYSDFELVLDKTMHNYFEDTYVSGVQKLGVDQAFVFESK